MKKLLSILLCSLFLLTFLASCNNESDNSSIENVSSKIESSKEDSTETSSTIESSGETSQDASEEPEPFISEIPEKAVYYTSKYSGDNWYSAPILNNEKLREVYSERTNEGLSEYFKNNDVSDDTYFLVGMMPSTHKVEFDYRCSLSTKDGQELIRSILKPYNFIEWENHPMLFDDTYWVKMEEWDNKYSESVSYDPAECSYELMKISGEDIKKKLPNIEFPDLGNPSNYPENEYTNLYDYREINNYQFYIIGYISAKDLKQLNEDLKDGEQVVCVTWFPAPDDQERWLTVNFRLDWKRK